jgi:fumarate hydratase, class II
MEKHKNHRLESDSLGTISIPADRYWGAQTARSLLHFNIGQDCLPRAMIRAYGVVKKIAAEVNCELKMVSADIAPFIIQAAEEVIAGKWDDHFPVRIWQTGSGTQSNMNVNEVIANRAIELAGGKIGTKIPVHPHNHVNCSQSTNDTFPTAMHIAAVEEISHRLLPALQKMRRGLLQKEELFASCIKIGRTHLMDAVPLSLGQEFSGYGEQIAQNIDRIHYSLKHLYQLALGGTAVGTGLNAPPQFAQRAIKKIADFTKLPFVPAPNKFAALAAHDALVFASGALRTLACSLIKIANDIAWMGSGPRCGLNELMLPQNEPGSSIMPGKVNPTQCEALSMVALEVIGHDTAITFAGAQGNFELNTFKPLIIYNFLHSVTLLTDACNLFTDSLLEGLQANEAQIQFYMTRSLMLATALSPKLGYDKTAQLVKKAYAENLSLKEACLALDYLTAEEFDALIDVEKMVNPNFSHFF